MTARASLLLAVACCTAAPSIAEPNAPSSPLTFADATPGSGLEGFLNVCGREGADKLWITEAMGAGAAWLDYDGDGRLDLYLVNGSTHARQSGQGEPNRLFRGLGDGKFRDVTRAAGVGDRGWGHGVAVGDIDGDGWPDLYVTNLGPNVLYRNRGDGSFEQIAERAGVADPSWGASAAFFDMEGDGDLDLYVANYVSFDPEEVPPKSEIRASPPHCGYKGVPVICGPSGLEPAQDRLYRNDGTGRFAEVGRVSGIVREPARYALGVISADHDNDGDVDVYVANDSTANSLLRNDGAGKFEEIGLVSLAALSSDGVAQAGMGVDVADYDGDGWLDLVVTNFSDDLNTIYRNHDGKFFTDESTRLGMAATFNALSWGVGFQDFDLDGDLDLFVANGHVYPEMEELDAGTRYRQRNHVFLHENRRFVELSDRAGPGLAPRRVFRGAAFADYDVDGDVDVLVTALNGPVLLLRNDSPAQGHFLSIRLEGKRSNRAGVGARVRLLAGGRQQIRERTGGGSYLSASSPWLHFGLGGSEQVEWLEVRWPSGLVQRIEGVKADQALTVTEPAE